MISVDGLTVEFGGTTLFKDISFQINEKDRIALMGKNGAGKSTLLKLMLGILTPDSGTIKIFGRTPAESARRIGYMPQYHQLDAAFPATVFEVALMGRARKNLFGCYSKEDRKECRR